MSKIDKYEMRRTGILIILFFCIAPEFQAQTQLNYISSRILSPDAYGTKHFRLAKLPQTSQFISHFRMNTSESGSIDLSLGDTPELYNFQPLEPGMSTGYNVFRIHDDALEAEITIEARTHNALTAQTGTARMEYTASYFLIESTLDTMGYIQIGSDFTFNNASETFQNYCLFNFDDNQSLSTQRIVAHKPFSFVSQFAKTRCMSGTINETVSCQDFNFKDTIIITSAGSDELYFSETFVPYLEAKYTSGTAYGGILSFDGHLGLLHSAVWNEHVYRLFEISGSADLDPTSQIYNYTTPADEAHLIFACYDSEGHVLWHHILSKFSGEIADPGAFTGEIIMLNSRLAIEYHYGANPNDGLSSGTFHAMIDEDLLESGEMTVEGVYRNSPRYIHTIEPETGNTISVFSARLENAFENFARNNNNLHVEFVDTDLVSISKLHLNYLWDELIVRSHFPTTDSLNSDLEPLTNYCQEFILLSVNEFNDSEQFFLSADNAGNNGFFETFSVTKKDDSNYLLAGNLSNGGLDFIFANDVISITFSGGPNGLLLFTEKTVLSVKRKVESNFHIFPNPASEYIQISGDIDTPVYYQIFDMSGKQIKTGSLNQDQIISINRLPAGMYVLNLPQPEITGRRFVKN